MCVDAARAARGVFPHTIVITCSHMKINPSSYSPLMACPSCRPVKAPSLRSLAGGRFPTTLRITARSEQEVTAILAQHPTYSVSRQALGPQAILLILTPP